MKLRISGLTVLAVLLACRPAAAADVGDRGGSVVQQQRLQALSKRGSARVNALQWPRFRSDPSPDPRAAQPGSSLPPSQCFVHGRECSGHGVCDTRTGRCRCGSGFQGDDCSLELPAVVELRADCRNLTTGQYDACYKATHGGPCSAYGLAWDALCHRTCEAAQGQVCTDSNRVAFCSRAPECEHLCNQFYKTTCDVLVAIHSAGGRPRGPQQAQLPFLAQEDPMQVIKTENTPRPDGEGPAADATDGEAEHLDMEEGANKQIPAAIDKLHNKGLTTEENDDESVAYLYEFYVRDSPSCRQRTEEQCDDTVCAWTLSGDGNPECVTFLEAPTAIRYVVNRLKGQSVDEAFAGAQSATLLSKKFRSTANKLKSGIFSMFGMQRFAQQEEYYASAAART